MNLYIFVFIIYINSTSVRPGRGAPFLLFFLMFFLFFLGEVFPDPDRGSEAAVRIVKSLEASCDV